MSKLYITRNYFVFTRLHYFHRFCNCTIALTVCAFKELKIYPQTTNYRQQDKRFDDENVDCERSLLSAGLDFRACERKGGTADNTSRNEIRVAHTTQNRYACQSNLICSNYAINNFQSVC